MREFFKQELKTLYAKYQLKQYETLSAMEENIYDDEGRFKGRKSIAGEMIKALLDELERVCNRFSYIPDEAKKHIVLDNMEADGDFQGLNGRILHKWFEANKAVYWTKDQSKPDETKVVGPPVDFEDLDPDLQKKINDWKMSLLGKDGIQNVPTVSQREMDVIEREDAERIERESVSKNVVSYEPPAWKEQLMKIYSRKAKENPHMSVDRIKPYNIEGITISAQSIEEAQEIFLELLGDKDTIK